MAKTLSFMAMHFVVAFTVIYLMTGSLLIGGAVALVEPMINSVAHHFTRNCGSANARANKARGLRIMTGFMRYETLY